MGKSTVVKFLLILLYAAITASVTCACIISTLSDEETNQKPCVGLLTCSDDMTSFKSAVEDWDCRQWQSLNYNMYYVETLDEYYLQVLVDTYFPAHEIQQLLSNLNELKHHITSLSVNNVAIKSIDTVVYGLLKATNIDLSHNKIESFALSKFLELKSLNILNGSHNAIQTLETEKETNLVMESLSVLDLSHNLIATVPKYYFLNTPRILHLNLSHNSIEHFDDLTFEGLFQLKTLTATNNILTQIDSFVGRMVNLQELRLDFNCLKSLDDVKISALPSLEKLTVSNNDLKHIGSTLQYTFALTELDLSYNGIDVILKSQFLKYVSNLTCLDLSHNNISRIEATAFEGKNITHFRVHDNRITGLFDDNTFEGTNSDELDDLSGGKITELGSELFVGQNLRLRVLNFSNNLIFKIKRSSFINIKHLTKLDLSYNKLQSINFDTKDLGNLTHLYAKSNYIKKNEQGGVVKSSFFKITGCFS